MRIGFDARSLRRHWGRGVGRFWKGFWQRLWSEDAEDEFVLYLWQGLSRSIKGRALDRFVCAQHNPARRRGTLDVVR